MLVLYSSEFLFCVAVDGGYGQWSSYGECSRTCGQGKHTRTRKCVETRRDCSGPSTQTKSCKRRECPGITSIISLFSSQQLLQKYIKNDKNSAKENKLVNYPYLHYLQKLTFPIVET